MVLMCLFALLVLLTVSSTQYECMQSHLNSFAKSNIHFIEPMIHVSGSECCNLSVNASSTTVEGCCMRCYSTSECQAWVFEPSSGKCWLLRAISGKAEDLVQSPRKDRISAYKHGDPKPLIENSEEATGLKIVFPNRNEIVNLLNYQQPRGLGLLLGVGKGFFALHLLQYWKESGGLYLIDPYIHVWKGYQDPENLSDKEHQLTFENLRNIVREDFEFKWTFWPSRVLWMTYKVSLAIHSKL